MTVKVLFGGIAGGEPRPANGNGDEVEGPTVRTLPRNLLKRFGQSDVT